MPELSPSAGLDDDFVATAGASIDGGDGVNTLEFGVFQALGDTYWNTIGVSGGRYMLYLGPGGAPSYIDFRNIQALVGSPYDDGLEGNGQITSINGGGGDDTLV